MALSNVALFGGAFFTPVLVGKITKSLGWQWTFYFIAIFAGATLPFLFFFVPETAFRRPDHLNTDFHGDAERRRMLAETEETDRSEGPSSSHGIANEKDEMDAGNEDSTGQGDSANNEYSPANEVRDEECLRVEPVPKASFAQTLRLFNGRKTDESFFKLLLRPLPLFLHPGILWVSSGAADSHTRVSTNPVT
jgi:MFS family permease